MMLLDSQNSIKSGSRISPTARASETAMSSTPHLSWAAAEVPQLGRRDSVVPYEMYKIYGDKETFRVICRRSFDILIISTREAPAVSSAARKRAAGASATGAHPNK